jgi:predicted MFS family arabinose efflux permease
VYSLSSYKIPSMPCSVLNSRNPLTNLALAWKDPLFMAILAGWMLMGLGNLMLIPIRVEYLANPAYGINASNAQISFILVSTVLGARILSTRIWGFFFDRMNVITLRLILNSVFMLSISCFFFTDQLWLITVGAALLGIAFGGGGIMWALYVTKIAPPDRVAAYMSVHSFTTGLRMAFAPILGYAVMQLSHPAFAAWIALLLIGLSSLGFIPQRNAIRKRQQELAAHPHQ